MKSNKLAMILERESDPSDSPVRSLLLVAVAADRACSATAKRNAGICFHYSAAMRSKREDFALKKARD